MSLPITFEMIAIASRPEGTDIILYVAGLSFKLENSNPFDTSLQIDGMKRAGFPYSTVFTINTTDGSIGMIMCEPTLPIWTSAYGSGDFNESEVKLDDNSLYEETALVDFVTPSVTPKIIDSEYDDKTVYILVGEKGSLEQGPYDTEQKSVYLLKGSRWDEITLDAKIDLQYFHDWNTTGRPHNIDHHMIYMREQCTYVKKMDSILM